MHSFGRAVHSRSLRAWHSSPQGRPLTTCVQREATASSSHFSSSTPSKLGMVLSPTSTPIASAAGVPLPPTPIAATSPEMAFCFPTRPSGVGSAACCGAQHGLSYEMCNRQEGGKACGGAPHWLRGGRFGPVPCPAQQAREDSREPLARLPQFRAREALAERVPAGESQADGGVLRADELLEAPALAVAGGPARHEAVPRSDEGPCRRVALLGRERVHGLEPRGAADARQRLGAVGGVELLAPEPQAEPRLLPAELPLPVLAARAAARAVLNPQEVPNLDHLHVGQRHRAPPACRSARRVERPAEGEDRGVVPEVPRILARHLRADERVLRADAATLPRA
uniref:Uncharacterized protein n=1 Tax=Tetraselmis sp. GSL018 TaxID=582737 RepID=A0A061RY68_9CHLO